MDMPLPLFYLIKFYSFSMDRAQSKHRWGHFSDLDIHFASTIWLDTSLHDKKQCHLEHKWRKRSMEQGRGQLELELSPSYLPQTNY